MQLHELLKKTRKETRTKAKDMAKLLGYTTSHYWQIEVGAVCPDYTRLVRLAKHFGIEEEILLPLFIESRKNHRKKKEKIQIRYVNFQNVSAIQKAVQSALLIGMPPKDVHTHMIPIYWDYYRHMKRNIFRTLAIEHTVAYIKSSFDCTPMIPIFTEIAASVGYDSFEDFIHYIHRFHGKKHVQLTYNRIFTILGKGSACEGEGSLSKDKCVKDILQKIKNHEEGRYCYSLRHQGMIKVAYLIIDKFGVYMQDNDGIEYIFDPE